MAFQFLNLLLLFVIFSNYMNSSTFGVGVDHRKEHYFQPTFYKSPHRLREEFSAPLTTRNKNKPNLFIDLPGNQIDIRTRHRRSLRYESDKLSSNRTIEFVARLVDLSNSSVSRGRFSRGEKNRGFAREDVILQEFSYSERKKKLLKIVLVKS